MAGRAINRGMKTGDRVTIRIHDPEHWATGVAERLSGLVGTIEEIKPSHHDAGAKRETPYLVRFEATVTISDRAGAMPISAFHFGAEDLVSA